VLLTGVSKFSKVSLFSGLNQLRDITISEGYSTICGYTQEELENVFGKELEGEDLEGIRCWYNGYSWLGESVYNPFDVLLYLKERRFRPYWFETGTPNFLVKLLVSKGFYIPRLEELRVSDLSLSSFDVDNIEAEGLLFQTGYLTIRGYEETLSGMRYKLSYPNKEVRVALNTYISYYLTSRGEEVIGIRDEVVEALGRGEVDKFRVIMEGLFSGIPYEWYRRNEISGYEGYYASVVYSFLVGTGLEVIGEDYTNRSRIDLTVKYGDRCYIMEFKVIGRGSRAMEEIKSRGYVEKYRTRYKEIYLIGMEFNKEKRQIEVFEWEKVD
jgi:hypothetical protein